MGVVDVRRAPHAPVLRRALGAQEPPIDELEAGEGVNGLASERTNAFLQQLARAANSSRPRHAATAWNLPPRQHDARAVLLCAQTAMLLVSSLGDACSIGSPWGIQQSSRVASILLSFRSIVLMPVTVIWTIAAIVASFPPSECVTC